MHRDVRRVLVTLDVTDTVIDEARRKNIDVIISHHPLIFQPLRTIHSDERTGRLLSRLVRANIAMYAFHTNLDFTAGGVSYSLAEQLALTQVKTLHQHSHLSKKIVVYVPEEHVLRLIEAMSEQGAGIIGNYEQCSFRSSGVGTYKPMSGAAPYAGRIGTLESADEVRLEMMAPVWKLESILRAMRGAHPYDEVAYDVYDLANVSTTYGAGVIGELPQAMPVQRFLAHVKRSLGTPVLRYAAGAGRTIKRVAVCGGSGADLIPEAIRQGANAYITADITYHKFQEADGNITLIDAGHYETERPALRGVTEYLKNMCVAERQKIHVFTSSTTSNFVKYSIA